MTEIDKAARYDELLNKGDDRTEDETVEFEALAAELGHGDPSPDETPKPTRRRRKGKDEEESTPGVRYAAFNKSLGRYEGPVRDTKADAAAAADKASQDGKYVVEVREVK